MSISAELSHTINEENRLRLLFFGDASEEHLFRWAKLFADRGHEVHVATWNADIHAGYEPVVVHQLSKAVASTGILGRAINLWRLSGAVRRVIRDVQPDLIHSHNVTAYTWMATRSGFHPCVATAWGLDVNVSVHEHLVERICTTRAVKRADWLHCEGENTKQSMVDLGADPAKITVLPLGIDLERFTPAEPPRELVEKYGLAGSKVVVSTRTLTPIHDIESAIRTAALVLQKRRGVKFLIVSKGPEMQRLRDLAESLGICESVVFTGDVSESEMAACLRAADVFLSTTLSESGTAVSMAEAMACGLPVVNTETGDIRLWLKDGEGGYVVPVKDSKSMAERVLHLLAHPEERERAGRFNRRLMEERYDNRVTVAEMDSLYSRLVANGRDAKGTQ